MAIDLRHEISRSADAITGFLWTQEEDPAWLRFKLDREERTLKGFHISQTGGRIPVVTPFLYTMNPQHDPERIFQQVATAIFADIGRESVGPKEVAVEQSAQASSLQDWQSFMAATGQASLLESVDISEERHIVHPEMEEIGLGLGAVKRDSRKNLSMPRTPRYKVGTEMSGFEAAKLVASKGKPKGLRIPTIGDPDLAAAKTALASVSRPSSKAVSFYGTRDPDLAKLRMQAATSFPVLAGLIAERRSLARAVDEMRPLQAALMEITGLKKAGMKRIGKLREPAPAGKIFEADERIEGQDALGVNRARSTRISGSLPIDMALRHLSEMPPDRAPQDDEAWLRYNDVLSAIALPLYNATGIPVSRVLEAAKGDWVGYHAMLAKAADFDPKEFDRRAMALTAIDALEAVEHFNRTALLPQALASIRETEQPDPIISREFITAGLEASTNLILGNAKNVAVLMMEMARRYASRIPSMLEIEDKVAISQVDKMNARFAGYGDKGFPVLTPDFHASNGLVVRPLKDTDQLREEGRRLSHCVGGYGSSARTMRCHIYSVQDESGTVSHSTAELTGVNGTTPDVALESLKVRQHRSAGNRQPSEEADAAFKEFRAALASLDLPMRLEEVNAWKTHVAEAGLDQSRPAATATWSSILEFDVENEEGRQDYWAEWGEVLGGKVAKSPHPGMIYTVKESRDLVAAMSPRAAAIMIESARREKEEKAVAAETMEP